MRVGVVQRAAVVGAQDEEAHDFGVVLFQHFADGEEVAQRFGHFFAVHTDEAVVQPVFDVTGNALPVVGLRVVMAAGMPCRADTLGDFVFVVRELQIRAASVDVESVAEQVFTHGGAFDVPPRTTIAPRALPCRFACFGGFPQHKIKRITFETIDFHTLACAQVVQRFARQLSVSGKLAHGIVNVAVCGRISLAVLNQGLNHGNHLRNVFRRLRLDVGTQHTQSIGIFVHSLNETRGQFADGLAVLSRARDDFVVDVGDIAHISERITTLAQPTGNHVEHDHHAGMA